MKVYLLALGLIAVVAVMSMLPRGSWWTAGPPQEPPGAPGTGSVSALPTDYERPAPPKEPQEPIPEPGVPEQEPDLAKLLEAEMLRLIDGEAAPSIRHPVLGKIARLIDKRATDEFVAGRLDLRLTVPDLILSPEANRGRFVRFTGRVIEAFSAEQPDFIDPESNRVVEEVYMKDHPSGQTVVFFFINDDKEIPWEVEDKPAHLVTDWVEVQGIFLRTYTFDTQGTPGTPSRRTAAVLFVTKIRKIPPIMPPPVQDSNWFIVGLAIVSVVVMSGLGLLWMIMSRRYGASTPMRLKVAQAKRSSKVDR